MFQSISSEGSFLANFSHALSMMLIHSLWQGALLTILAAITILFTRKTTSAFRYTLLSALFFLFLGGCLFTFIEEWHEGESLATSSLKAISFSMGGALNEQQSESLIDSIVRFCSANSTVIVIVWLVISAFRMMRLGMGIVALKSIRTRSLTEPPIHWKYRLAMFADQLGLRSQVKLFESALITVPVVIGYLKPVIYMPIGALNNLPAEQVEAILLHELAHIRRNDFLANFIQNITEAIFFFNPGLMWVSSVLRQEREHCCDDIAVAYTRKKKPFIQALINFTEYEQSAHALAFPAQPGHLLRRVARLVYSTNHSLSTKEKIFFTASLLAFVILLSSRKQEPGYSPISEQVVLAATDSSQMILSPHRTDKIIVPDKNFSSDRASARSEQMINRNSNRQANRNFSASDAEPEVEPDDERGEITAPDNVELIGLGDEMSALADKLAVMKHLPEPGRNELLKWAEKIRSNQKEISELEIKLVEIERLREKHERTLSQVIRELRRSEEQLHNRLELRGNFAETDLEKLIEASQSRHDDEGSSRVELLREIRRSNKQQTENIQSQSIIEEQGIMQLDVRSSADE